MVFGQTVLLVYGAMILVGGWMGFRAGSKASLIAGTSSGLVLIAAFGVTYSDLRLGLWIGAAVSLLLCVMMAQRLAKTRKFMPAGMTLLVSVVTFVLLLREVLI